MTGQDGPVKGRALFQKNAELQIQRWRRVTTVVISLYVELAFRLCDRVPGICRIGIGERAMHIGFDVTGFFSDGDIGWCAHVYARDRLMFRAVNAERVGHCTGKNSNITDQQCNGCYNQAPESVIFP
jgi:hypothetical protein